VIDIPEIVPAACSALLSYRTAEYEVLDDLLALSKRSVSEDECDCKPGVEVIRFTRMCSTNALVVVTTLFVLNDEAVVPEFNVLDALIGLL